MLVPLSIAALGVASAAYYSPLAWRYWCVHEWRKQLAERRTLILTYDDGPSETVTPRLLELLGAHGAKASFFLLGCNAIRYPSVVERIAQEGHDLGCHSDQHLNAWHVAPWRAVADISAGYRSLASWVRPDGMFRPPYGKMTLATFCALRARGAKTWWWTIDSGDTHEVLKSPADIVQAVTAANGGIVLLHDLERSEDRENFVLETTALLLEAAKRSSINVKKLSEFARELN